MNNLLEGLGAGVLLLAGATSLLLALVGLLSRGRGRLQWSLGLGMAAFAVEAVAAYALVATTETPAERLLWLRAHHVAGLLIPLPWGLFAAALAHPAGTVWPLPWRAGLAVGSVAAAAMAASVSGFPAFEISDIPGPFYAARLGAAARDGVVVQLLWTVGILAALEACLRTSKGASRWRIKYLVLGLGGIFVVRFFFLSQFLLFHVIFAVYLTTMAATLVVGNIAVAAALARDRLIAAELTVSRGVVYRSVVIGTLGLYLFAVGVLGWLLNRLGIPEETFWTSMVVFVSALALAAVLLSENVRWRLKRFIGVNFYRSKYDYRREWMSFTKRLGSLLTIEDLAPQLVTAVTDALGTARGALYLLDDHDGTYRIASGVEVESGLPALDAGAPLVARLTVEQTPLVRDAAGGPDFGPELSRLFLEGSVAVPLIWRGALRGILLVGTERTGTAYVVEDLEYLTTVGQQAAGVLVTARLAEAVAQSREFEAFHRLTSFVIHDLKNSISSLSLLSQNALQHGDDPEFQRDAVKTLSRTVARMRALLARLSSAPDTAALHLEPVDLSELAREAAGALVGSTRVHLSQELGRTPRVMGDPEALLRVIQNLVGNAVEALDGEGAVTVKAYAESGCSVVAVADTGCGIAEEFLRRSLFVPFRSTKKGGWGIGLYQAKAIVEAHRGTIEVASREGHGTTFWVRIPIAPGPARVDEA